MIELDPIETLEEQVRVLLNELANTHARLAATTAALNVLAKTQEKPPAKMREKPPAKMQEKPPAKMQEKSAGHDRTLVGVEGK